MMVAVGIIGGAVPFVLFFEGLQRAGSTDAAFLQKTLVVWVALLAVPLLQERLKAGHLAAIALLAGALITAALDVGARGAPLRPHAAGLVFIAIGIALVCVAARRSHAPKVAPSPS